MNFSITILGNNSAIPANGRHPTSQVVTLNDQLFLVDCGEGTQMQMNRYKIKRNKINHIFISHLHGDHYFGLIGLLNSIGLQNRTNPLHIFAPTPLEEIIRIQLECANTHLPFGLHFHALHSGQNGIILKEKGIEISTFPTTHRIDCFGFVFKEKHEERRILPKEVEKYEIPYSFYKNLKLGEDYIDVTGTHIPNEKLTAPPGKEYIYAFCADTKYEESIIPYIKGADMIYHEATYLEDNREKAEARFHSTAIQAAQIAKEAEVKKLLVGHFSSRYYDLEPFAQEAQTIFSNALVSQEGTTYLIKRG